MSQFDEDSSVKTLTSDQIALLLQVIHTSQIKLTPAQWEEVSDKIGGKNGRAVKERFRYLMSSLENFSRKKLESANLNGVKARRVRKRSASHFELVDAGRDKRLRTETGSTSMRREGGTDEEEWTQTSVFDEMEIASASELPVYMSDEEFDELVNSEV